MLANPDSQRKAQVEIDRVVKPGHLPDFSDEASLPYVTAVVKELLRWKLVVPLGQSVAVLQFAQAVSSLNFNAAIPHYLLVDDVYKGYRIPAGSIVISNLW